MAAILRVKRRNDDEPLNALVIACKRFKSAENDENEGSVASAPLTTVLKFAGTVKNQEDNVVEHLVKTLGKNELKTSFKQHPLDVLSKTREKTKQASANNRYKVINCCRSLDTSNIEEIEDKVMTVIDVEDSVSCAAEEAKSYVYDLYYAHTENELFLDNVVSVHALDQELVFDTYRNNEACPEDKFESEDSNSESNWKNDYPDSDHSEESIDEDDIREAVIKMRLEDESDLSSEDDFVYAVDEKDVELYGFKYAKYKARIKEESSESNESDLSDNSEAYVSEETNEEF